MADPKACYTRNCQLSTEATFPRGMSRIALGIEYNGSQFHGFQCQPSGVTTVQYHLNSALSTIADEPITTICAGRTDAGVHATNQVVHFDTLAQRSDNAWLRGANSHLPDHISIRWTKVVAPQFHSRFSAISRCYRYIIHCCSTPSALLNQQVAWQRRSLDIVRMRKASVCLIGEHDFSAFRAAQCQSRRPFRCIQNITIEQRNDLIIIEIKANAFLYHMVRNIVGVLTVIGAGDASVGWCRQVLNSRDRRQAGVTAAASGLYLVAVDYPNEFNLPIMPKGPYIV